MNGVLTCECGALKLEITSQSYSGDRTVEAYKCEVCGRTGLLTHDEFTGTTLSGCLR